MQLDAEVALGLIRKAQEQEREERLFQQWVAQLPIMALTGVSVSFADYKARVTGTNIDLRPTAEIMAELDEVERDFINGGGD